MERKLATALFADLVDSTGLGEQDPERTRVLLERFYDTLSAEIELAGGGAGRMPMPPAGSSCSPSSG